VRIRAHVGDIGDATAFLQGPDVLRNVSLPVAGIDSHLSLVDLWRPSTGALRVEP